MSSIDTLIQRVERAMHRLKPKLTQLPYVVMTAHWDTPADWQAMLDGKTELADMPGYEQRNEQASQMAESARIAPKLYLFDPEIGSEP